ncbi:unnamed protein product [Lactuca saligna]|uniref:Uncharacterized protein n=1 Tax=Lactuca saligna TaxID=75948 RepID=A0AA36EAC1_LACSI|nr:unnamed protein product [Lactuca saligna]
MTGNKKSTYAPYIRSLTLIMDSVEEGYNVNHGVSILVPTLSSKIINIESDETDIKQSMAFVNNDDDVLIKDTPPNSPGDDQPPPPPPRNNSHPSSSKNNQFPSPSTKPPPHTPSPPHETPP